MRIVLDSSVLIAAHITRAGVCAELLEDVLMEHQLFTSQFILDEVARKLLEKFAFPESAAQSIINFITHVAAKVEPATVPDNACRDPGDIPILGTALAAEANLLITVDRDLLAIGKYSDIAIIKPGAFWRLASI
ncbi:MAG TPA: putative toxin-antitoxin system toxin component, PIN family [Bryobacteraceae bacterium]|nr:putative toxin-antitoxin system toxin component, PIN family [Bryobacteraceae bacterium]